MTYKDNFQNFPPNIKPTTIDEFFNDSLRVSIPTFQRPYSWTDEEVQALLVDIRDACTNKTPWFLGVIYWKSEYAPSFRGNMFDWKSIIDGQQRMTTLFLLFRELSLLRYWMILSNLEARIDESDTLISEEVRNFVKRMTSIERGDFYHSIENGITSPDSLQNSEDFKSFYSTSGRGLKPKDNRLSLARDLRNPFSEYLLQNVASIQDYQDLSLFSTNSFHPSEKNLYFNRIAIKNCLLDFLLEAAYAAKRNSLPVEKGVEDFFTGFVNALNNNLWFIEIPLGNNADLRIFEGINDRGQPLDFVSKFRFITLSQNIISPALEDEWKSLYEAHGIVQSSVFNQRRHLSDRKFTVATYVSQFLQSCGEDLTEDSERLEVLKSRITVHSMVTSSLVDSLLYNLTVSVNCLSVFRKRTDPLLKGVINYNLYLNTYNDQTRVIQFFINRQLTDVNLKVSDRELFILFWTLNNFIFAVNHNFDLPPNKKRNVIVGWINEFGALKWDIWNVKTRIPIQYLTEHLEYVTIDRVKHNILDSFKEIDLLNLRVKTTVIQQYLHHVNHVSEIDIFKRVDVHVMRFDESVEHWLPQKPKSGKNHWGDFLGLTAAEKRKRIANFIHTNRSKFVVVNADKYEASIDQMTDLELNKTIANTFGNFFGLDRSKNSSLKNNGHTTKQTNAKWHYFYNQAVSDVDNLQTIPDWTIERILERTAYLESLFKNIKKP
jgi:hypothetical protein